jgi:hypothetical protein
MGEESARAAQESVLVVPEYGADIRIGVVRVARFIRAAHEVVEVRLPVTIFVEALDIVIVAILHMNSQGNPGML